MPKMKKNYQKPKPFHNSNRLPLSLSSKQNTAPLFTKCRSWSCNLRLTLGKTPCRQASNSNKESFVVSTYPKKVSTTGIKKEEVMKSKSEEEKNKGGKSHQCTLCHFLNADFAMPRNNRSFPTNTQLTWFQNFYTWRHDLYYS